MMKHTILAVLMAVSTLALAQTSQDPWGGIPENSQVNTMSGPRFGISYIGEGSTAQVLNRVQQMDSTEFSTFSMPTTLTTQYGWQWETRFADTGGPVVGLHSWKNAVFPRGQVALTAQRFSHGTWLCVCPRYNYQKGDLNLPINIAFVPNKQGPADSLGTHGSLGLGQNARHRLPLDRDGWVQPPQLTQRVFEF